MRKREKCNVYPYLEESLRLFMLDDASVDFHHILITKLADGCSNLFPIFIRANAVVEKILKNSLLGLLPFGSFH